MPQGRLSTDAIVPHITKLTVRILASLQLSSGGPPAACASCEVVPGPPHSELSARAPFARTGVSTIGLELGWPNSDAGGGTRQTPSGQSIGIGQPRSMRAADRINPGVDERGLGPYAGLGSELLEERARWQVAAAGPERGPESAENDELAGIWRWPAGTGEWRIRTNRERALGRC